jgi:hypothetical protein
LLGLVCGDGEKAFGEGLSVIARGFAPKQSL